MDTDLLLRIFGGCAAQQISRFFLSNSCIASTAITIDVLAHYGREAQEWQVCLQVFQPPFFIEVGCYESLKSSAIGGHLVAIVEGAFLVDASIQQVKDAHPTMNLPDVFVGALKPEGASLQDAYHFATPFGELKYTARTLSADYRQSPDWGDSPERRTVVAAIIRQVDGYLQAHGIT